MGTIDSNRRRKKKLDFQVGDLVYLKNDLSLDAGVGVVISTECRSFDIHDMRDFQEGKTVSVLLPKICVWWAPGSKKLWMDEQDIELVSGKRNKKGK